MNISGLQFDTNYHTHSNLCDGKNTLEEMAEAAFNAGIKTLGFSGHSYTEYDESVMTELGTPDYCGNNYAGSYSPGGYAALAVHDATGKYAGEVWLYGRICRFNFVA